MDKAQNCFQIPVYEKKDDGSIRPNYIFHRPHNRVHSRCIEYPWCASHYSGETNILDVGSAKSDMNWVRWLESLGANVYLADYDLIGYTSNKLEKVQCDIRKTGFEDNYFDIIFAVSVLEHIGLEDPQVIDTDKPRVDEYGDVQAFHELIRILKPGGRLFLTIPFSNEHKLIFNDQARCYSLDTLRRYELPDVRRTRLDIYQYLPVNKRSYDDWCDILKNHGDYLCELQGAYSWERISHFGKNLPQFKWCVDCVAMAAYEKLSGEAAAEASLYRDFYLTACDYIVNAEIISHTQNYLVYGTGGFSSLVTQLVCDLGGKVIYYSDTNPSRWGTEFMGKPVIPPYEINNVRNEFRKIIIASSYLEDISEHLKALGFNNEDDIIFYPYSNLKGIFRL